MQTEDLLRTLIARAPWRAVVNPIVHLIGMHPHLGFEDTLNSLTAPNALTPDQNALLRRYLIAHLLAGEKSIRLYRVSEKVRATLKEKGASATRRAHPLVDAYPLSLPETEVRQLGILAPRYCATVEFGKVTGIIFTGSATYRESIELHSTDLRASAVPDGGFEKVVGTRLHYVHTYDAVIVDDESDVVVVACDIPRKAPNDFADRAHVAIAQRLRRLTGEEFDAVNLWPAVAGLYDAHEGSVVELGFITNDESVKHLKARRNARCLREDAYHEAGASSVGDALQPFKLAVRWQNPHQGDVVARPEILLPGTARHVFKANGELPGAILRNGLTARDLKLIVSKLEKIV